MPALPWASPNADASMPRAVAAEPCWPVTGWRTRHMTLYTTTRPPVPKRQYGARSKPQNASASQKTTPTPEVLTEQLFPVSVGSEPVPCCGRSGRAEPTQGFTTGPTSSRASGMQEHPSADPFVCRRHTAAASRWSRSGIRTPFRPRTRRWGRMTGNRPAIPVLKSAPAAVAGPVQVLRTGLAFPIPLDLPLHTWQKPCACL